MQVSATDADIRSNAEITYTLFGPGAEKFKLNPDTGNDRVWGKINCVSTKSYIWVVFRSLVEFENLHVVLVKMYLDVAKLSSFRKSNSNVMCKIGGQIKKSVVKNLKLYVTFYLKKQLRS